MAASAPQAPDLDVAVIGGGPGGLAAAKAILTARPDLRVAVFERSTLRPRGAALLMQPNGIAALEAIDPSLAEGVMAMDPHMGPYWLYRADGSVVSLMEGKESPQEYIRQRGGRQCMVSWHELQALLARSLPPGVLHQEVHFDRYEEAADGSYVTLHFKGGRPPLTARLLIGADGSQSGVRQQLLSDGPPLYAGAVSWRAVMPCPDWWPKEPGSYCIFGAPPTMLGTNPLHDGTIAWQAFAAWPDERIEEVGGRGVSYVQDPLARQEQGEARRARALEVFGSWCPQVRSLIEGTDALALTEHAQLYRMPESCKVWGAGPVTLLGDSAHLATPMLAQGTNQAMEDAVELGRAVAEHGATPEALRAYETVRQPQAEVVQRKSVELFLAFKSAAPGTPVPQQHKELEKLGVWQRVFAPLPRPGSSAA